MKLSVVRPGTPQTGHPIGAVATYQVTARDYVLVDSLDLRGTFKMADCMSAEDLGKLARFANALEKSEQGRRANNARNARRITSHNPRNTRRMQAI